MYQARLLILKWLICMGLLVLQQEAVATECVDARGCKTGAIWIEAPNLGGVRDAGNDGFLAMGFDINVPAAKRTVALGYREMKQDFLSSRYDRETELRIDGRLKVISVSRLWHRPARKGYLSGSVGLSFLRGHMGEDCNQVESFLFPRYSCDSKIVSTVGIPLRISAGFGRYVGIAAHIELNLNPEVPYILTTFSFPIGKFAR